MRLSRALVLVSLVPAIALAHVGEPLRPDDLWSAWEFDPGVVFPIVMSGFLYWRGSSQHVGLTRMQQICFWSGLASLVLALISPVHRMGEVLFSAHMMQHEILMLISAPLLVYRNRSLLFFGQYLSNGVARWAAGRKRITSTELGTSSPILSPRGGFTLSPFGFGTFRIFDLTLRSKLAHSAHHLSFFLSALIFWWALFYAHGRKTYGAGVLYIFTTAVHTGMLGALLTLAPRPWYSPYRQTTLSWGFTPLEDQQLGGLIMWFRQVSSIWRQAYITSQRA